MCVEELSHLASEGGLLGSLVEVHGRRAYASVAATAGVRDRAFPGVRGTDVVSTRRTKEVIGR
jgi:hypothetical protein